MRSTDFFAEHPVFTHGEYLAARAGRGATRRTSDNLLGQHLAAGNIVRIRRGLYASVPRGVDPTQASVDPYLVATKVEPDAVVAFHAALQFHGKAYSLWNRFHYLTSKRAVRFAYRDLEFVPVRVPADLRALPEYGGGILERRHGGGVVRVTTLERTLADVLDAPDKAGGWEEVWRSLEMIEFFDLDAVFAYVDKRSAMTAARVGFFLEQHREQMMVEEQHLERLAELSPAQPRYLDGRREEGKLISRWNIIVPERVLQRTWQEDG